MKLLELRFYPIEGKQHCFKVSAEGSAGEVYHEPLLPFLDGEIPDVQDRRFTIVKVLESTKFAQKDFSDDEQAWMVREQLLLAEQTAFNPQFLATIGRRLYVRLGQGIQQVVEAAVAEAKHASTWLHIRLRFPADDPKYDRLTDYPWELLHNDYGFLAHQGVTFSRYIAYKSPRPNLQTVERLNVLLISAGAGDERLKLKPLPSDEREAILQGLQKAQKEGKIELARLNPPTFKTLRTWLLERQNPHVLHFDGHGFFGKRCNEAGCRKAYKQSVTQCECGAILGEAQGYLVFKQLDGTADFVSAIELGELLGNLSRREQPNSEPGIALVVLSACRSGMSRLSESVFNGVAQNLVGQGIPAVVAMQYSISVSAASAFSEYFYRSLGEKESLVIALQRGQSAMGIEGNQWYRPVLYLRWEDNEGGQLFAHPEPLPEKLFLAPPRPNYSLVGRDKLLDDLKLRLLSDGNQALSALNGIPGVGKTALAIALASDPKVQEHFQDGILWAGLGRDAGDPDVLVLLETWARAVGITRQEIAKLTKVPDRAIKIKSVAQAIRQTIGMRRMLLVIDDAWQIEKALAFQVGGPKCAYLLTTRQPEIAAEFAGKGATPVGELSEDDGLNLLETLLQETFKAERDDLRELVRAVGSLPLALILIGNYLFKEAYSNPLFRPSVALKQLRESEERLKLARSGSHPSLPVGASISLDAVIEISYKSLTRQGRSALRALSVFPPKPNDFSVEADLAVSASSEETLITLAKSGLLEGENGILPTKRLKLHQTIADYARQKLNYSYRSIPKRISNFFNFLFSYAPEPHERLAEFFVNYLETHKTDFTKIGIEKNNIAAALQAASDQEMEPTLVRGANLFFRFLDDRGLYEEAEKYLKQAKHSARSVGDKIGIAKTLKSLGLLAFRRGEYPEAAGFGQEGLKNAQESNDSETISDLCEGVGLLAFAQGNFPEAKKYYEQGLCLARKSQNWERVISFLGYLAALEEQVNSNYEKAEEYYQKALEVVGRISDDNSRYERHSFMLGYMGWAAAHSGKFDVISHSKK